MSASRRLGTIEDQFRAKGYVPPEEWLEMTARHIVQHERNPEKRAAALLVAAKKNRDALLVLAEPALLGRAGEYCRSVAMQMAAEGGGRHCGADEARSCPPPPTESPEGARAGQSACAEEAGVRLPARDTSAPADGREGRSNGAEQAKCQPPACETTMTAEEGRNRPADKAIAPPPSLPPWADAGLILSTAMSTEPWKAMRKGVEAEMETLAKQLPVWPWWSRHRGTGAIGLAIIVGEAGDLGSYRDKSALWKRLGLAVIDGERQQRKRGDDGIKHGYSPRRRAEIWTIADSMLRAQWAGAKDEDGKPVLKTGKPVATPAHALGPYGGHYARRKAYVTERERGVNDRDPWSPKHINDDAKRYMTKKLLRDLRAAWRAAA